MPHQTEIAASFAILESEMARLATLLANSAEHHDAPAILVARDHLAKAAALLRDAARKPEPVVATDPNVPGSLAGRMLASSIKLETFRTRVTVKATVKPVPVVAERPAEAVATAAEEMAVGPAVQDLTRIRGIDRDLAARLRPLGFTDFQSVARMTGDDVRRVSEQLGLGRQISRQNWIEQAALLCGPWAPVDAAAAPIAVAAGEPAPKAAIAVQAPDLPDAAPFVTVHSAREPSPRVPVADRLDLIKGIEARHLSRLAILGINRWSEVAVWGPSDIARVETLLGIPGEVSRGNWVEQAALLSARGTSAAARLRIRGLIDIIAEAEHEPPRMVAPLLEQLSAQPFSDDEPVVIEALDAPLSVEEEAAVPPELDEQDPLATETGQAVAPTGIVAALPVESNRPSQAEPITTLDRLEAIELELAALIANDTGPKPVTPGKHSLLASDSRALAVGLPSFGAPQDTKNVEDEEFGELSVEEAEVMIVQRRPLALRAQPATPPSRPTTRTLLSRLTGKTPLDDIDPANYAAYRDQIEEATVEIVKRAVRKEGSRE